MPTLTSWRCTSELAAHLRGELQARLSPARLAHVMGVEGLAVTLAHRHGVDAERVMLAALFHDLLKGAGREALTSVLREARAPWQPTDEDWNHPPVWHGLAAANVAAVDYGITDHGVLEAVYYHTTGRPGMGPVGLVLYVADCLEPTRDFPGVHDQRRRILPLDLAEAALAVSRLKLEVLVSRDRPPHQQTQQMRDWLEGRPAIHPQTGGPH